ncbi:MAG TPA: MerR family transcriptional regulator [Salinivirgaceae bacterium]|nr:MerR family transcriptional regulator [Salinivirgaceae bacterium]
MPYKEPKIEKLYYTIGEVAEIFNVNTSKIRYYENIFDVLKPKKNKKGNRLFTKEDIENLSTIFHLINDEGLTIKGVQARLKESKSKPEVSAKVKAIEKLEAIKSELLKMLNEL